MTTSPNLPASSPIRRGALRLQLHDHPSPGSPDGAWWPRSRDLQTEAADLIDHFPSSTGRIQRLLFSRPDWDGSATGGRGVRRIMTARGPVKVGSFPNDDTHLMIATMGTGRRLRLVVIPSDISRDEGQRLMREAGEVDPAPGAARPGTTTAIPEPH